MLVINFTKCNSHCAHIHVTFYKRYNVINIQSLIFGEKLGIC